MWQRFTERARKVVFYAQEEAQRFGEGYVSTEHMLLGLVRESDSTAARVLETLDVSLNRVRAEIEKQLPRGESRPSQDMTLTPRCKRVIDLAYDEARNLNNNYIGTEHLLLGLIREQDGLAGRVLEKLGVKVESARAEVTKIQDSSPSPDRPKPPTSSDWTPPARTMPTRSHRFSSVKGLSDEMRRAIFAAHEIALSNDDTLVGPEDLMRGLLRDRENGLCQVLDKLQIDIDALDAKVQEVSLGKNLLAETFATLTPQAERVLRLAESDAEMFNSPLLKPEHCLLGFLRDIDSPAELALMELGVDYGSVRTAITEIWVDKKSE